MIMLKHHLKILMKIPDLGKTLVVKSFKLFLARLKSISYQFYRTKYYPNQHRQKLNLLLHKNSF